MSFKRLALLFLTASPSFATDFIVDVNMGPGTDFASIQEAVFTAVDGDRIFVRAGTYDPFVVREGLQIQGEDSVYVAGPVQVLAVPATERVVIAHMTLEELLIRTQSTTAILDCEVRETIDVRNSLDVRFHRVTSTEPSIAPRFDFTKFELVGCRFEGLSQDYRYCGAEHGLPAMVVTGTSGGRIARTTLLGGKGGDTETISCFSSCATYQANGGVGIATDSGHYHFVGVGTDTLIGGNPGAAPGCFFGQPSPGVYALNSRLRISGVATNGIFSSGSQIDVPPSDDIAIQLIGDATPGATTVLEITGPAGTRPSIFMGRGTRTLAINLFDLDHHNVDFQRSGLLPPIDATGRLLIPVTIPAVWPTGTLFWVEAGAMGTRPSAPFVMSNSVALLVR